MLLFSWHCLHAKGFHKQVLLVNQKGSVFRGAADAADPVGGCLTLLCMLSYFFLGV